MRIIECVQYSDLWWEARIGIPTASQFKRIVTPSKLAVSASADGYINELIAARLHFDPPVMSERPMNAAMRHGVDTEPDARNWYAFDRGVDVQQVGFCTTDDGRFGASPDGLVGEDGGLELKCPQLDTQIGYLRDGVLPHEYVLQVHGSLIVTGRAWWDFLSYCPPAPAFLVRVTPDQFTERLAAALEDFHDRYSAAWQEFAVRFGTAIRRAG